MYFLFRYHDKLPSEYQQIGFYEKRIIRQFMYQQLEDIREENKYMIGGGDNV